MFNCNIKYNDTNVNIEFPCTNLTLFAKLADLHVPDEEKSKMDIYIEEVSYEPLKCLEGKSHDPDAVNLLAKKLCSLTSDEVNKFEAVRELNGITDLYDMINITDNMHYYTLVKDMSDIKAVGKLHIMIDVYKRQGLGGVEAVVSAQCGAEQFYIYEGYERYGEEYFEDGFPHIMMKKDLTKPCRQCQAH